MVDDSFRNKGPDLLKDLADNVADVLAKLSGIDPLIAESLGQEVAERMGKNWGGLNIYFPKGMAVKNHRLARELWAEYNGRNTAELARKYQISLQWTYTIIRAMRAEEVGRNQGKLFA